ISWGKTALIRINGGDGCGRPVINGHICCIVWCDVALSFIRACLPCACSLLVNAILVKTLKRRLAQGERASGEFDMQMIQKMRVGLIGLMALAGVSISSAAHADSGVVRITVVKAGWFLGGAGGTGTLTFHGRTYPLSIGGLSAGLVFGASGTHF